VTITNFLNELSNDDVLLRKQELFKRYEEMLLTALLYLPHKDRHKLLVESSNQVALGIVSRAEEYMRANLN